MKEEKDKKRAHIKREDHGFRTIHSSVYVGITKLMEKHKDRFKSKDLIVHDDGIGSWGVNQEFLKSWKNILTR